LDVQNEVYSIILSQIHNLTHVHLVLLALSDKHHPNIMNVNLVRPSLPCRIPHNSVSCAFCLLTCIVQDKKLVKPM